MALAKDVVHSATKLATKIYRVMSFTTNYDINGTPKETFVTLGGYVDDTATAPVASDTIKTPGAPPEDGTKAKVWAEQKALEDAKFVGAAVVADAPK